MELRILEIIPVYWQLIKGWVPSAFLSTAPSIVQIRVFVCLSCSPRFEYGVMSDCANLDNPRVAIVGSGAIGAYFGACMAEAGIDVHFLMRRDLELVRSRGLYIQREHAPSFLLQNVQCYGTTSQIGPCDLVIIAIKSTDNDSLPELVKPLIHENTVVLTLQNGLGNVEFLQKHFGEERALGGLVFMGINRTEPGRIENYNPNGGTVTIGEPHGKATERVRKVCHLMHRAQIIDRASDDLQEALWRKLVWNVPFNGLSIAARGVTTDVIINSADLCNLAKGLMKEVQAGAKALCVDIPDSFIEGQVAYTKPLGAYRPSSMLDYLAGRPVEVEAIWGEPFRRGVAAGAKMPLLGMLYALLKTLVANRSRV